jgi:hypothetical protein
VTILDHIKENGPLLSSELIDFLAKEGKSNEAARKQISRLPNSIFRIKGLFKDKQFLFYHEDIYGHEEFYSGLIKAFEKAGKQYQIIIEALDFNNGFIRKEVLASYSMSPIGKITGHLTFQTAISNLINLKIIIEDDEYYRLIPPLSKNQNSLRRSKAIEIARNFLLIQFSDWSRKIGLVSYNTSTFNSTFGKYQFNFVSASFVGSLPEWRKGNKPIPGFVIADILIGNPIKEKQVTFFIEKIKALRFQAARFIPILIVDSMDPKSMNALKSNGVMIGFTDQLFGEQYKELLNSLINLVMNAGAILKKNPDAYFDLIKKLNKLVDGKTNNLRGDLFELAVGYLYSLQGMSLDIGKLLNYKGKIREIDIYAHNSHSVYICECKGYNSKVTRDDIDVWLGHKIPVIREWILEHPSIANHNLIFQFWSLLNERIAKTNRYQIEYYDPQKMIEVADKINAKKFIEVLQEYYLKEIDSQ